ncbi:GNAT family N-acetyltransferase [Aquimarina sp. MMG016]|uniref:GNAT family N-acetyltransferase n=1 Tax=Aquimarina sp. MMG016 TaxID=2822690 RepID=UPI001B39FA86|nr:GNAT family N-acetyltransferase [Aquimarina sp. MMG016]MBQ4820713.1 GNAT family N-acetyltransferase [Aquimarina sp. MMG016]
MTVKNLSNTSFDELLDCFLLAFENYFVKMPTDRNYYSERWKASKVDFSFSYGMFDNEKLVGFIIHSIDKRNGVLTAYNSGTGVIPKYRGNRIVESIYQYALQVLEKNNIEKSTLEVITNNTRAIRSYKKIGFKKIKTYKCFSGNIKIDHPTSFKLEEVNIENINWTGLPNQHFYSWDNQKESILVGKYTHFLVENNGEPESFFVIKPESGYVAQFDILKPNNKCWNRLFCAIKSISPTIKINNVDERLTEKIDTLRQIGLENLIDQYEMELTIKGGNNI